MLDIFIISLCLALNAFFSAYEMAFVTIRQDEVDSLENRRLRKRVLTFKQKPERTLSAIQVGITMVGSIAAAVGGTGAVENLEPWLIAKYKLSPQVAEGISVAAIILPLTYLSVVLGEIVPKTIAIKRPRMVLTLGTGLLHLFERVLNPVVSTLEISTSFLLRKLKVLERREEMSLNIDIGPLAPYHRQFVQNLVGLRSKIVERGFIPIAQVSHLDFSDSEEVVRDKVHRSIHTRLPVMDGDICVGYLHTRIYLQARDISDAPWDTLIHPIISVKRDENILEVFLKMQKGRKHLAAVVDKDEKVIGIISLEDVIEEIVGDIEEDVSAVKLMRLYTSRPFLRTPSE